MSRCIHVGTLMCVTACSCVNAALSLFAARTPVGRSEDSSHEGFTLYPSGAYHQVVKEGSGPKTTRCFFCYADEAVTVKFDLIEWRDGFREEGKLREVRGEERCLPEYFMWFHDIVTDMRVGEVRRVILPQEARQDRWNETYYYEYTLRAIL